MRGGLRERVMQDNFSILPFCFVYLFFTRHLFCKLLSPDVSPIQCVWQIENEQEKFAMQITCGITCCICRTWSCVSGSTAEKHVSLSHNLSCSYWLTQISANEARGALHQPEREDGSVAVGESATHVSGDNGSKHHLLTTMAKKRLLIGRSWHCVPSLCSTFLD